MINEDLSINQGGLIIAGGTNKKSWTWNLFESFLKSNNIDMDKPIKKMKQEELDLIFYGSDKEFDFKINTKEYNFDGKKSLKV